MSREKDKLGACARKELRKESLKKLTEMSQELGIGYKTQPTTASISFRRGKAMSTEDKKHLISDAEYSLLILLRDFFYAEKSQKPSTDSDKCQENDAANPVEIDGDTTKSPHASMDFPGEATKKFETLNPEFIQEVLDMHEEYKHVPYTIEDFRCGMVLKCKSTGNESLLRNVGRDNASHPLRAGDVWMSVEFVIQNYTHEDGSPLMKPKEEGSR